MIFERLDFEVHVLFNFISDFAFLVFLIFLPFLFFSGNFFFVLPDKLILLEKEVAIDFLNALLELLLVELTLFTDFLFRFSSDQWVLSLARHSIVSKPFHLRRSYSWRNIVLPLFFGLESQKLLSVLLIQRVVIHFLISLRVNVKNLVIVILVGFPRFRYWSLETFLGNEKEFLVLLKIHTKNDRGILMNFYNI